MASREALILLGKALSLRQLVTLALMATCVAAVPRGAAIGGDAAAAPQIGRRGGQRVPSDLSAGKLLVARRGLGDPNFLESVVLLFAYAEKNGAAGLILNRQSRVSVRRVLPDLPTPQRPEAVVFLGGPVAPTEIRGLLRSPLVPSGALRVLPGVSLVSSRDALDQAVGEGATAERLRVYAGYAGWSPGQLEREIERGDWHVTDADVAAVFAADPEKVWPDQIRRTDVLAL